MTTDIQAQIDKAKSIIRAAPRGPYKRIPSASTDHKLIGIPGHDGDHVIASAVTMAHRPQSEAEAMAVYITASADPFCGWNAMIDALIAARGAVAPVHVVNNSMTIDPHVEARAHARARLIAAVNEEAEFVKPDVNLESVIDTAITRLGMLTRDRRRALAATAKVGDLEQRLHSANEKIKRLEVELRSSRTMEQLQRDEVQESRELGEAPRPPSYAYNYDAACPLTGDQVIAIIKQTITDTLFRSQSDAARGLADAPPPWLIAAVARGAAAGMDIARNNPLTFATARQVMRETLAKNDEKWLLYRDEIERQIEKSKTSSRVLASRILAGIFGVEVGRLGIDDEHTIHAITERDARAEAAIPLASAKPSEPTFPITFETARGIMRREFARDLHDGGCEPGGVLGSYIDNIAMLVHDRYGVTDHTRRSNIGRDVMRLLFDLKIDLLATPSASQPPTTLRRVHVNSAGLRKDDSIISCDGTLWVDRTVLTSDAKIVGEMAWLSYVPTGSPFGNEPNSFQYDAHRLWLVERAFPAQDPVIEKAPTSNTAPDPNPIEREAINADHRILIYAGGKVRVVPMPMAITGTCSALAQLAAAIVADAGERCNGDGQDHDWIEVRAEAPSVGEIDPDSAQVPW